MLLSKEIMKKANTYIEFTDNKIITFDEEVPVKFSSSGYYYITTGKVTDSMKNLWFKETIYFSSTLGLINIQEKRNVP